MDGNFNAAEVAAELKQDFDKKFDKVLEVAEAAKGRAEKSEKMTEGFKEKADEALAAMGEVKAQLTEIEQKMARRTEREAETFKSAGRAFVESEEFKACNPDDKNSKARFESKATLTNSTAAADGSVGAALVTTRLAGVVELPRRPMTIRALLGQGNMDGQVISYIREHSQNLNAGMVAEGAIKPQSDFRLEEVTETARVIPHSMKVSRQALSDVSGLRSMIDVRLRHGLDYVEEIQLLNGDGTGQNLRGIIPQATAYAAPAGVTGESAIDKVRYAILQASLAMLPPDGVVMHPTDWALMETAKDTTTGYLIGNPQGTIAPTLWGQPVVTSMSMSVDKFLVGAFGSAAQIFDRWETTIEVGYVNDDFTRNLSTILAEKRLVLATYRPSAFIYGDFGRVA